MSDTNIFAERLKSLRLTRNVSRTQMSEATAIPISSLGNYERGDKIPSLDILRKICDFFKVSADYLLGISESPTLVKEWPPAAPAICFDNIETIKNAVYEMIKDVTSQQMYGWDLFDILKDVVTELSGISEYVEAQRYELSKMHPDFQKFGDEASRIFGGKHLRGALAEIQTKIDQHLKLTAADNKILDFDKHLRAAEDNIFEKLDSICRTIGDWLLNDAFDAIMGRPTKRIAPTPEQIMLQNATPDQRESSAQGKLAAQRYIALLDLEAKSKKDRSEDDPSSVK